MITVQQYFGPHFYSQDATPDRMIAAGILLDKVNALLDDVGFKSPINPATESQVSGQTFGGFRPHDCPQGAPDSSHKLARGVDIYDPHNALDESVNDVMLEKHDLYREHPDDTQGWLHLTDRAPRSGNRTFKP